MTGREQRPPVRWQLRVLGGGPGAEFARRGDAVRAAEAMRGLFGGTWLVVRRCGRSATVSYRTGDV